MNDTKNEQPKTAKQSSSFLSKIKTILPLVNKDEEIKEANLEEEGKAYFDKEKNRWVFEGEEDIVEEIIKPPPLIRGSVKN